LRVSYANIMVVSLVVLCGDDHETPTEGPGHRTIGQERTWPAPLTLESVDLLWYRSTVKADSNAVRGRFRRRRER